MSLTIFLEYCCTRLEIAKVKTVYEQHSFGGSYYEKLSIYHEYLEELYVEI